MSHMSDVGYAATQEYASREKRWLLSYAVVKNAPSPWNMLVGKKVATRLRGYAARRLRSDRVAA